MNHETVLNAHYKALALANLYVYYEMLDRLEKAITDRLSPDDIVTQIRFYVNDSIADLEAKLGEHYGGSY